MRRLGIVLTAVWVFGATYFLAQQLGGAAEDQIAKAEERCRSGMIASVTDTAVAARCLNEAERKRMLLARDRPSHWGQAFVIAATNAVLVWFALMVVLVITRRFSAGRRHG
jgi:hypothetical protein